MKTYLTIIYLLFSTITVNAQWTTQCGSGDGMVVSFAAKGDTIYATGFFKTICGTNANYIAGWDGAQWFALDTGLSNAGHRVELLNDQLYVAQYKQIADSNWVLKWDGNHFEKIGEGVYLSTAVPGSSKVPNLYDVALYNGKIIASGEFDIVGNKHIFGIMQWDGNKWDSLGSGLSGSIDGSGIMYPHQLLVYNSNLYVVGNFSTAGGISVNGIAMWDGSQWHAVGSGFNKNVYGIGLVNNELYVGGEFTISGTTALQRLAKWDGSAWINPGFGVYYSNASQHAYVHSILQVGSRGIFEGGFDHSISNGDSSIAHSIIAYDGTKVDTMDGGISEGEFEGLLPYNSDVLVGGALFTSTPETTHISSYHFHNDGVKNIISTGTNIYPNPVENEIIIENANKGQVCIYNLMGQLLENRTMHTNKEAISISYLPAGTYILSIGKSNGIIEYIKIIKE